MAPVRYALLASLPLFALAFSASPDSLWSDTHLVSRRYSSPHSKRFIDDAGRYNITILHLNDVHAHLDQFTASGTDCHPENGKPCYGGYARFKTKVDELRGVYKDSLLINAGDEFQGTLFYTYLGPSVIAETINQLGFDAITLGNHEFDGGNGPLVKWIKELNFSMICANVNSTDKSLEEVLVPYKVFPQHGLVIVAVTTADIPGISNPDEGTTFLDPTETVQKTVDYILEHEDVRRIVVMTHIGYDLDIKLARNTRNVHLVVGGHSHTLLGNFTGAAGPYPTIVENLDGEEVFVVTASKWGQYLGKIDVAFDCEGKIVAYTGSPILMDATIPFSEPLQSQILEWRKKFDAIGSVVVGETSTSLDQTTCQQKECNLGDAITDAMIEYRLANGGHPDGAIMNAGGIRASIDAGQITKGGILQCFPFMNAVVDLEFTGKQLWDIFEVSQKNSAGETVTSFVQVSKGIQFTYDPSKPQGSRLVSLSVGQADPVPPIDLTKEYTITTLDYIATGGKY
ncbi:hypothetical protein FRC04_003431 [Tulasnella sp. 424]|nr:hypothetical protein FRC04_003431 [Tulasnella sp. 424]KAG8977240.1 hypothetical protein FRC05_002240 [Tulasnella sp. 425]